MTGKDVRRLEELRREVTLMQSEYGTGDAYDRFQAALDGLDEAIDGPRWRVSFDHENLYGPASVVVRAWSSEHAMARTTNLGYVPLGACKVTL